MKFKKLLKKIGKKIEKTARKIRRQIARTLAGRQIKKMDRSLEESLEECNRQEQLMIKELGEMEIAANLKISAEQQKIAQAKQSEIKYFNEQRQAAFAEQAQREASFKEMCEEIRDSVYILKGALYACAIGNEKIVESILEGDFAMRHAFLELNPLHIAAAYNKTNILRLLCRHAANLSRRNGKMQLASDVAERRHSVESVKLLKELSERSHLLRLAAIKGNIKELKEHLQADADCNALDKDGYNALQLALMHKAPLAIIELLISDHADCEYQGNAKKTTLQLAGEHPDQFVKSLILDCLEVASGVELPKTLFASSENSAMIEGLQFSDQSGWYLPQYFKTIQEFIVPGQKGQDQLFRLARGGKGIILYQFINSNWQFISYGPAWGDKEGWYLEKHYLTIKTKILKVGNEYQLFIIGRSDDVGINLWTYHFNTQKWEYLINGPCWNGIYGWGEERHYNTIQIFKMNVSGQDTLFLIGRSDSHGIHLYSYHPIQKTWTMHSNGPAWNGRNGWFEKKYFSTIQANVVNVKGQDELFLVGRSADVGINLWSYNPANSIWRQKHNGPIWNNKNGWDVSKHFETIKNIVLKMNGQEQFCVYGLSVEGIEFYSFDPEKDHWIQRAQGPRWHTNCGWYASQYYSTIQMVSIPNGTSSMGILAARASVGMLFYAYSLEMDRWVQLASGPQFSDINGWGFEKHHATIHISAATLNHRPILLIDGRDCQRHRIYPYQINLKMISEFLKRPMLCRAEVRSLLEYIKTQNEQFLILVQQGSLELLNNHLQGFVDIGVRDSNNQDALQLAILKGVHLNIVKRLVSLGLPITQAVFNLSRTNNRLEMAAYFADLLGLRPLLGFPLQDNWEINYQKHSTYLQAFLNKFTNQSHQAMISYYRFAYQRDPFLVEAPLFVGLISELNETYTERLQKLFKETLAFYHTANELGDSASPNRNHFVHQSLELKKRALKIAQEKKCELEDNLVLDTLYQDQAALTELGSGITKFLQAFSRDIKTVSEENVMSYTNLQKKSETRFWINENMRLFSENLNGAELLKATNLYLKSSLDLQQAIPISDAYIAEAQRKINEMQVVIDKEHAQLISVWQTLFIQHQQHLTQYDQAHQHTLQAHAELVQQVIHYFSQIKAHFEGERNALRENYRNNRKHLERKLCLNLAIMAGITILTAGAINPMFLSLGMSAGAASMAAGAVHGLLSAQFNHGNVIKEIIQGAALAGVFSGFRGAFGLDKIPATLSQQSLKEMLQNVTVNALSNGLTAALNNENPLHSFLGSLAGQLLGLAVNHPKALDLPVTSSQTQILQSVANAGVTAALGHKPLGQAMASAALTSTINTLAEAGGQAMAHRTKQAKTKAELEANAKEAQIVGLKKKQEEERLSKPIYTPGYEQNKKRGIPSQAKTTSTALVLKKQQQEEDLRRQSKSDNHVQNSTDIRQVPQRTQKKSSWLDFFFSPVYAGESIPEPELIPEDLNLHKQSIKKNSKKTWEELMILTENHDESLFFSDDSGVRFIDSNFFEPCVKRPINFFIEAHDYNTNMYLDLSQKYKEIAHGSEGFMRRWWGSKSLMCQHEAFKMQTNKMMFKLGTDLFVPQSLNEATLSLLALPASKLLYKGGIICYQFGKNKYNNFIINQFVSGRHFRSAELLETHYVKHAHAFSGVFKTPQDYLKGAREVIKYGQKVEYTYANNITQGYIKFIGRDRKGLSKFEFVNLNDEGYITTYHVKGQEDMWKLLSKP